MLKLIVAMASIQINTVCDIPILLSELRGKSLFQEPYITIVTCYEKIKVPFADDDHSIRFLSR